jgi:hypothetical protein
MEIHVFKTNVTQRRLPTLKRLLAEREFVEKWSVDLQDRDRVLRVVCPDNTPAVAVREALTTAGLVAEEL